MAKIDPHNPPKQLGQKSMKRLLKQDGWRETRGGKHVVKMVKDGAPRPITLPHSPPTYPPGLRDAILKQAGLKPSPSESDAEASDERGQQ